MSTLNLEVLHFKFLGDHLCQGCATERCIVGKGAAKGRNTLLFSASLFTAAGQHSRCLKIKRERPFFNVNKNFPNIVLKKKK